MPLVGITAYEGLVRARVRDGQKVLIHGGAGGVGHLAVQIAIALGADVYSTCADSTQASIIEGYGATAINYEQEAVAEYVSRHTANAGFDVVYDTVGGPNLLKSFEAAALNAQVSTTVAMTELDLTAAHFKGLSLHVVFMLIPMLHGICREAHGEILSTLAEMVDAGKLKPLVDEKHFDISEAGEAHAHLSNGRANGKVVIDIV